MFCLLTFLDDFRGAKVSCRRGPELSSEQRLELFEVSLGLTSEEVNGSVFKVVDIIVPIVSLVLGLKLDGCKSTILGGSTYAKCE